MTTAAERREKLRNRSKQSAKTREEKGLGGKSILDWSKYNGERPETYKVKAGKNNLNVIDFLPFVITQDWYKDLKTFSGLTTGLDVGDWEYKLEIPVHKNVGENNETLICNYEAFGKRCPNCEDKFAEYEKNESEQNEKKIQGLKATWRCFYNVYDYDEESNPDGDLMTWEDVSYYNFEKEILEEADEGEEVVFYSDIEEGKTVEIKGKEAKFGGNTFIKAGNVEFKDRDPYPESIVDETVSFDALVKLVSYDEFKKIRDGEDSDSDSGNTETKTESKPDTSGRRRRFQGTSNNEEEKQDDSDECHNFGNPDPESEKCTKCDDETFQKCAEEADKKKEQEQKDDSSESTVKTRSNRRRRRTK